MHCTCDTQLMQLAKRLEVLGLFPGWPVLLSAGAGFVLTSVGGKFIIGFGISTSASLVYQTKTVLLTVEDVCSFFGTTCHLLF